MQKCRKQQLLLQRSWAIRAQRRTEKSRTRSHGKRTPELMPPNILAQNCENERDLARQPKNIDVFEQPALMIMIRTCKHEQ